MRRLVQSLQIRHVDAGSCNACEQELSALLGKALDIQRYGIDFVASPRHADALIVTGPVTDTMQPALEKVWEAVPNPRWLIATGDCAAGCGVFQAAYASHGGVGSGLTTPNLIIHGCPPNPEQILEQLRQLLSGQAANGPDV